MTEQGDTTAKASVLRTRMVRAALAVGAVVLLMAGAIGVHTLTANAALGASGTFPLNYSPYMAVPVPAGARAIGPHNLNDQLTVTLVLHPQHESELQGLIQNLSTKGSSAYRKWWSADQFRAHFAPAAIDTRWLTSRGLHQVTSTSPFLKQFVGTTKAVEAAFGTQISNFRTSDGHIVFANTTPPRLPLTLMNVVGGVVGLDNVNAFKYHPELAFPHKLPNQTSKPHYGGAPGGNGLTPSQFRGLYDANGIYSLTKGQGRKLAVFELSEYNHNDIASYENEFGIPHAPVVNVYVDGGPCPAAIVYYGTCDYGAAEVELDIEMQVGLAPGISRVEVYNGPNTTTGALDTYFAIANQDSADAISTSWGSCEPTASQAQWFGEYLAYSEMAIQGQSIFAAAGDAGAYDCEHDFTTPPYPSYYNSREVDDPASNPYITSVGGTSFLFTYDPMTKPNPTYPKGAEYVWNTLNNCMPTDFIFQGSDLGKCPFGAGGGGNSRVWSKPFYQGGPGTTSNYSEAGGFCQHLPQRAGTGQCREVPDVSMNADPNSGYAIFCTDAAAGCPSAFGYYHGWLQIGGTSAAAPLFAAIAALADGYGHERIGLANIDLYNLNNSYGYAHDLHDISGGVHYTFQGTSYFTNRNGASSGSDIGFPEVPYYDMATGLGTPDINNLVKALS